MRLLRALCVGVIIALVSGAAGCGGGGARVSADSTTLGQELQDLKTAYEKGIISEKDYNEAKKKLIEKRTE